MTPADMTARPGASCSGQSTLSAPCPRALVPAGIRRGHNPRKQQGLHAKANRCFNYGAYRLSLHVLLLPAGQVSVAEVLL